MTTLLSCLPVDRLREWHARCEGSMENIAVVADRLASAMIDLQSSIASETALRFDDVRIF